MFDEIQGISLTTAFQWSYSLMSWRLWSGYM